MNFKVLHKVVSDGMYICLPFVNIVFIPEGLCEYDFPVTFTQTLWLPKVYLLNSHLT